MHLVLQQDKPDDYVIATGVTTSVRDFVTMAFKYVGIELEYSGKGVNEVATIIDINREQLFECIGKENARLNIGDKVLKIDPFYYRPTEVQLLVGDATKAEQVLGWKPKYNLQMLVDDMMESDVNLMKKEDYLKQGGFKIQPQIEDIL
jgi:GDPmannose 4,6-dehydratase